MVFLRFRYCYELSAADVADMELKALSTTYVRRNLMDIFLAAGAALLPILLLVGGVVAIVGLVAAVIALLIPAIPFVLLGLVVWAFMRRQPAAVVS